MKRQGDLLIIQIPKIPSTAVRSNNRVLAEGEKTGHCHVLEGADVYQDKGRLFFSVEEARPAILVHPEHKPIIFSPGQYKVVRQREYLPGGWRHVPD